MTLSLPLRGFTVLVVEDDHLTLKAFSQVIVQVFGCIVLSASSGEAALRVIASGEKLDLLFSDVVMPEMDGLTLARLVRAIAGASYRPDHWGLRPDRLGDISRRRPIAQAVYEGATRNRVRGAALPAPSATTPAR